MKGLTASCHCETANTLVLRSPSEHRMLKKRKIKLNTKKEALSSPSVSTHSFPISLNHPLSTFITYSIYISTVITQSISTIRYPRDSATLRHRSP